MPSPTETGRHAPHAYQPVALRSRERIQLSPVLIFFLCKLNQIIQFKISLSEKIRIFNLDKALNQQPSFFFFLSVDFMGILKASWAMTSVLLSWESRYLWKPGMPTKWESSNYPFLTPGMWQHAVSLYFSNIIAVNLKSDIPHIQFCF